MEIFKLLGASSTLYLFAFPVKCMHMISGCVVIERNVEAQRFNGGQSRGGQT